MQDTKVVIPLYSMSTAYKRLLGIQQKPGNIFALFMYNEGDLIQAWRGHDIGLGIEEYTFRTQVDQEDYLSLLKRLYDYETFINTNGAENATNTDEIKSAIAKFNASYNPETATPLKRLRCMLKMGKPCPMVKKAYDEYTPMVIKKDIKDLVVVDGCTPIFSTHATSDLKTGYNYIYELRLVKSICSDSNDVYFMIPCVQISQFRDIKDADKYYQDCRAESELFGQHALFSKLADRANPAIHQFIKYWSH